MLEYWRGVRRIGFGTVGAEGGTSVYFSCPAAEVVGRVGEEDWFDLDAWLASFPHLRELMSALARHQPTLRSLIEVYTPRWVHGRAVLIGDAAHSIAPTFAQGGCLAMQDAVTLAAMVGPPASRNADLAPVLADWERRVRPLADRTQRYTRLFSRMSLRWPHRLSDIRSLVLWSRRHVASQLMDGLVMPTLPSAVSW
jgi:2-polyprenyl-6-methoxyphenol hydroxylase-like FAD-dependent oxidoreductase